MTGVLSQDPPLWLVIGFVVAVMVIVVVTWRSWRGLRGSGAWSDEPHRPHESESPFWVPRELGGDRDAERDRSPKR